MIKVALALGVLATAAATAAPAQYYGAPRYIDSSQECWNPGAGHFEQVRPGEYQGDLDYNRCRTAGSAYVYDNNRYYSNDNYHDRRVWRESRQECWNPRSRHFEEVRAGERQDDLDYSRCRVYR